jgi:Pyruvate/2-oxoacid:ferredoxin oxidoreductase delta subunit
MEKEKCETCGECNFYCIEKRICIKTQKFEFERMPACDNGIKNIN